MDLFNSFLVYLKRRQFNTVFLTDIVDYLNGKRRLPPRSIALTFDDGYLDNWTIATPLLQKFGLCGTVFVNPEFVDSRGLLREQITGIHDSLVHGQLNGFMSWQELKAAESSGTLDIQSHGMTHTWYFSSNRIVDYHHPGDDYPWLAWNERPERKPLWLEEDQSRFVAFGAPVYEHEKAVTVRRCFVPREIEERVCSHVEEHGREAFFTNPGWRKKLDEKTRGMDIPCRYETEDEYQRRLEWEVGASREEIESRLSKKVDIICWPGGGHNQAATETALRCGYRAWTLSGVYNRFQGSPYLLHRISIPMLRVRFLRGWINRLVYRYKVESSLGTGAWAHARLVVPRLYALGKKAGLKGP